MLFKLFKKKQKQQIVVTFTDFGNGIVTTDIRFSKSINVGAAATAIDRIKADISQGLAKSVAAANLNRRNPKQRAFIRRLTLGDIF